MSVCIDELSNCRGETQIPQSLSMGGAGVLDDVAHVMRKQGGTPSPHGGGALVIGCHGSSGSGSSADWV